ncbi:MAG TPA: hypothetical protein VNT60_00190, partial [Deinococcales bacterium]|nr:hypothetical protein [Deinococcales bacterium]
MTILKRFALPADPVERGLTAAVIEGSLFNVWAGAVIGNYLTGAALLLGAQGLALGVLGGLPAFATMLQLLSAPLVLGRGRPRNNLLVFSGLQRFAGALAGPIALLVGGPAAVPVFVGLHVFAWAWMAPGTVVWQGYMTDLVPPRVRGSYFSRRHVWSATAGIVAILLYGAILARLPGVDGFKVLWAIAVVAAVLDTLAWLLHPDLPPGDVRTGRGFWETLRIPLQRPGPHRTASFFLAAWAFAQGLAAPFFPLAALELLRVPASSLAVLATVASLASIASAKVWGRWIDTAGHGRVLGLATGLAAAVPL